MCPPPDVATCTQACEILSRIASHVFTQLKPPAGTVPEPRSSLTQSVEPACLAWRRRAPLMSSGGCTYDTRRCVTEYRAVTQYFVTQLLGLALFDDSQLIYSFSRPLLIFIMLEEEVRSERAIGDAGHACVC